MMMSLKIFRGNVRVGVDSMQRWLSLCGRISDWHSQLPLQYGIHTGGRRCTLGGSRQAVGRGKERRESDEPQGSFIR